AAGLSAVATGRVDALGSIASAVISASADTTSAQVFPETLRSAPVSAVFETSDPTARSAWLRTATLKLRTSGVSSTKRARVVRAVTSATNADRSGQPELAS